MVEFFEKLFFLIRHLGDDKAWTDLLQFIGGIKPLYAVLFSIIFAETGIVIFPFLPGDSLLFAVGAMSARDIGLSVPTVILLLFCAAILGDNCNYWLGRRLGPRVFNSEKSRLLNRKHLLRAQAFYEKHGAMTIILARFVPIIRTFAPFVAGVGRMKYGHFLTYSVAGGIAWVNICVWAGWLLGSRQFVKDHFEIIVLAIVAISVVPVIIEFIKARKADKKGGDAILEATTLGERVE
jgi:membrane-associated protein